MKSDLSDPVVAGEDLTYQLDVTNHGPAIARDVVVDDVLPAGTSFVSATGGGTESAGMVSWNLGDVAAGTIDPLRDGPRERRTIRRPLEHGFGEHELGRPGSGQ